MALAAMDLEAAGLAAVCQATFTLGSWRWGLWSPRDKSWLESVQNRWQEQVRALPEMKLGAPIIPLIIHQIWLGSSTRPEICEHFAEGWRRCHPTWEYRLWTDEHADALLDHHPRLAQAFKAASNPAEKSDILRLVILQQHGGLYVDVDFECLQPLDDLHRAASFYTGLSNVGAFELNNGLFAAAPGHALLSFLCEHVDKPWPEWGEADVDPAEAVAYQLQRSGMLGMELPKGKASFLATTGPGFFTRAVMRAVTLFAGEDPGVLICPPEVFYPLPNGKRKLPLEEIAAFRTRSSMAVHHWLRTWGAAEGLEEKCACCSKSEAAQCQS
ncbi:unnamed protein product [Effrenium voratum]|nr:unnamed protein product [Effrenium voratum]